MPNTFKTALVATCLAFAMASTVAPTYAQSKGGGQGKGGQTSSSSRGNGGSSGGKNDDHNRPQRPQQVPDQPIFFWLFKHDTKCAPQQMSASRRDDRCIRTSNHG